MVLEKIVSGGQTGADQAGLRIASKFGIPTGGTAPPGYRTESGPAFGLLVGYGLKEGDPDPRTYPRRTHKNITDSDGTVIFYGVASAGSNLTVHLCGKMSKPYLVNPAPEDLAKWIRDKDIKVLNVAGNRHSVCPEIDDIVETTLGITLEILETPTETKCRRCLENSDMPDCPLSIEEQSECLVGKGG